jgi:hypothetical protein
LDSYSEFLAAHSEYLYRLEQNTFVVESIGMVYMDTPKTAGTSIKTRLAQVDSGYVAPRDSLSLETVSDMFIHDRSINPLKPITAYTELEQREMLFSSSWKRFCVVRNPFNRLFSAWFSKLLLRQPGFIDSVADYELPQKVSEISDIYRLFENFVIYLGKCGCDSDPHWNLQTRLLFHNDIEWDHIFRFENLQQQLRESTEYFGGKVVELDKLNVSGFTPDWNLISDETISLIQDIYKTDFEAYGYSALPPVNRGTGNILVEYINAVAGRNSRIYALTETNRRQQERLKALDMDYQQLRARLDESEFEVSQLAGQLNDWVNSRSWKLTSPLRKLFKLFRAS